MYNLGGRRVLLGVAGSVAAYKAVDLASQLTQMGAQVDVILTKAASRFISPLSFTSVTRRPTYLDMFQASLAEPEVHVQLGREADVLVAAPATASLLARLSLGLAQDLFTLSVLCSSAPLVVCPAMDANMWEHPAVQGHVRTLQERGALLVGPEVGRLASGRVGVGRLAERDTIIGAIRYVLGKRYGDLAATRVVVTAGGTQEPIDPIRYVSNYSSGKMGYAVAEAARDRGAQVTLVTAPTSLPDPYGVTMVRVRTALEMRDAVIQACQHAHALIMAAAVADYRPAQVSSTKIKRGKAEALSITLVHNPDILAETHVFPHLVRVGFAAETEDLVSNARRKLRERSLHLVVANDVTAPGAGFGTDTNKVVLVDAQGEEELPLMTKYEVAWRILDRVASFLRGGQR